MATLQQVEQALQITNLNDSTPQKSRQAFDALFLNRNLNPERVDVELDRPVPRKAYVSGAMVFELSRRRGNGFSELRPPAAQTKWNGYVNEAIAIVRKLEGARRFTLGSLAPAAPGAQAVLGLIAGLRWRMQAPRELSMPDFQEWQRPPQGPQPAAGDDDDDADDNGDGGGHGLSQAAGLIDVTVRQSPGWGCFTHLTGDAWHDLTKMTGGRTTQALAPTGPEGQFRMSPAAAYSNLYDAVAGINPHPLERRTTASTLGSWVHSLVEFHLIDNGVHHSVTEEQRHLLSVFRTQTRQLFFPCAIAEHVATVMCNVANAKAETLKARVDNRAMCSNVCQHLHAVIVPRAHTIPLLRVKTASETDTVNFIPDGIIYNPRTRQLHVFELKTVWGEKSRRDLNDISGVAWRRHRRQCVLQAVAVALTPGDALRQIFEETGGWPTEVVATVIVVRAAADERTGMATMGTRRAASTRRVRVGDYKVLQTIIPVAKPDGQDCLAPVSPVGRLILAQLLAERGFRQGRAANQKRFADKDDSVVSKETLQRTAAALLWNVVPMASPYGKDWASVACTGPNVRAGTLDVLVDLILPTLTLQA